MSGIVLNDLHVNVILMYVFAILGIAKPSWIQMYCLASVSLYHIF